MPAVHKSIRHALWQEEKAVDAIASLIPEAKRHLPALSLPPGPESEGLLVGRVLSRSNGTIVMSHNSSTYCQAVFVPPLAIRMRAALVYCTDYRVVHAPNAGTVLEIFSEHVKVLLECPEYTNKKGLEAYPLLEAAMFQKQGNKRRNAHARVFAKSPIMGKGNNSRFLMEITNAMSSDENGAVAVFVVFVGNIALKWWPFLRVGGVYTFAGLKHAKLPNYGDKHVFKVSDDVTRIYDLPVGAVLNTTTTPPMAPPVTRSTSNGDSSSPPKKRMKPMDVLSPSKPEEAHANQQNRSPFRWSEHTVSYQGVISEILHDGRMRLDNAVYLHLGADYAWCAGGAKTFVCFRVGARIEALNVLIAFQRGIPTTVFPTARTVVSIVYFGPVPEGGVVQAQKWHRSPWFRYWVHLPPAHILWAQELYDTLPRKFHVWLASSQSEKGDGSVSNPECSDLLVSRMLGSKEDAGLLEYLMELITGNNNLFQQLKPPTHFYSDFLNGNQALRSRFSDQNAHFPYPATISEISAAIDVRWLASATGKGNQKSACGSAGKVQILAEIFSEKDLSTVLSRSSRKVNSRYMTDVVLIGTLEGCTSELGSAQVSDATGSIHVELIGNLDPALLGAIVVVQSFEVAVELFPSPTERKVTLLLDPVKMKILIDGPFVEFDEDDNDSDGRARANSRKERPQRGFSTQDSSIQLRLSQTKEGQCSAALSSPGNGDVEAYPLAAICVEAVSSVTQDPDGQSRFRIEGYLIAFCRTQRNQCWELVTREHGFSRCRLIVHGNAAVKIRPSLSEGFCYGIGCSDFADCEDIGSLCRDRAEYSLRTRRPLLLYSASASNEIWVQRLEANDELRLKGTEKDSTNSTEGRWSCREMIDLFAEHFELRARSSFVNMLSLNWASSIPLGERSLFCNNPEDDLVSLTGVFLFSDVVHTAHEVHAENQGIAKPHFRLYVREKGSSLLILHIIFHDSLQFPRGLAPGTTLRILNVVRQPGIINGIVVFSAGELTRIVRTSERNARTGPSLCCHRPLLDLESILPYFPVTFLWKFSLFEKKSHGGKNEKMTGVVRVNLLELKHISFFTNPHSAGCPSCGIEGEPGCCAGAQLTGVIEDGTTIGEVECNSFPTVMEMLGATHADSLALRQGLSQWKPGQNVLTIPPEAPTSPDTPRSVAEATLQRLLRTVRRSFYIVAKNTSAGHGSDMGSESPVIDEADVRGHNLGFGKKLWTAESPKLHQVRVEALAVLDEDLWHTSRGGSSVATHMSTQERYNAELTEFEKHAQ